MFTGLVECAGKILKVGGGGTVLTIRSPFAKLALGESVAVDGVCLTVASRRKAGKGTDFAADVSEETLRRTTLGRRKPGDRVNLERCLRAGDRLGGHFMQGHVDGVGKIEKIAPEKRSKLYSFSYPEALDSYLVPKGSIAVDGISLTIVEARRGVFTVSVIPYTETHTSLDGKKPGDEVNLEADILAKIAAKQVQGLLRERMSAEVGDLFVKREIRWEDLEKGPQE